MGVTFHFDSTEDLAEWLDKRAKEYLERANSARTQRDAHTLRTEANTYREVAEIINTSIFASETA